ncbi:3-hydroxyisobutyryl-CoA hydrolase [compost metagenome]
MLDSRSPSAMAITLELLRRGRELSLSECFAQELQLNGRWFEDGDLKEGIRALLIDKDNAPVWRPVTVAELDPHRVQAFFDPQLIEKHLCPPGVSIPR